MKKHLVSFLHSPLGYAFNFLASVDQYIWVMPDKWLSKCCEEFCLNDGVQDDPLF